MTRPESKQSASAGGAVTAPALIELALVAVLVPLAGTAWLALVTASVGHLSLALALLGGLAPLALAAGLWFRRRPPDGWRSRLPTGSLLEWATLALVAASLLRLLPAATPWPAFLDASWYVNTGAHIAAEGKLLFRPETLLTDDEMLLVRRDVLASNDDASATESSNDGASEDDARHDEARSAIVSTLADGRAAGLPFPPQSWRGFHDVVFAVPDVTRPEVGPYHPPFFASWIAVWVRLRGMGDAGGAVLPWALAYLLAAGALATAAFGRGAGALAVVLVAAGPAFAYYGATPYAETAAGALALAGLWLLVRLTGGRARPLVAAAAGLALGLAVLVKVDAVLVLPVAGLWWLHARRRTGGIREAIALVGGAMPPLAHFGVLAMTVSGFYVSLNGGGVVALARREIPTTGTVLMLAAGGWLLARRLGGRARWSRDPVAARRVVGVLAMLAVALGTTATWLAPEAVPPSMLAIMSWAMTPLGLWAGVAGLVLALEADEPRTGPLLAAALLAVPAILLAPIVTQTLSPLYTARRLVPLALPVMSALAGGAASRAAAGRASRGAALMVAACALMVVGGLRQATRPLDGWRDFSGGATIAARLAAYGDGRDVLLFPSTLGDANAGRMAAALWTLQGRPTAVLGSPDPDPTNLAAALAAWTADGRRSFFVADDPSYLPELPGYHVAEMGEEALVTYGLAPLPELPVRVAPLAMRFLVFELVPAGDLPGVVP